MKKNILKIVGILLASLFMIFTTVAIVVSISSLTNTDLYVYYQSETLNNILAYSINEYYDLNEWQEVLYEFNDMNSIIPRELDAEFLFDVNEILRDMGLPYTDLGERTPERIAELQEVLNLAKTPEIKAIIEEVISHVRETSPNPIINFGIDSFIQEYNYDYKECVCKIDNFRFGSTQARIIPEYTEFEGLLIRLSSFDGVLPWDLHTAGNLGRSAIIEGDEIYPYHGRGYAVNSSQWMLNDAFRHFTWSLRLARNIGPHNARIITNNYEFASMIIDEYTRVLDSTYRILRAIGVSTLDARPLAELAAIYYASSERSSLAWIASLSDTAFGNIFGYDHIMDFWNNWQGFTFTQHQVDHINAFYDMKEAGRLILGECGTHVNHRINELRASGIWRHF